MLADDGAVIFGRLGSLLQTPASKPHEEEVNSQPNINLM